MKEFHLNLAESKTFEDIFDVLQSSYCWSWFNFGILKSIISRMHDSNISEMLEEYEKRFEEYCSNRRIYECPTHFSNANRNLHRPLLVELPEDISLCDIKELEIKLARILAVKNRDLVLLTYKVGSTVLIYSLPRAVADEVFPLSPEQKKLLTIMGIRKCYLYHEKVNIPVRSYPSNHHVLNNAGRTQRIKIKCVPVLYNNVY